MQLHYDPAVIRATGGHILSTPCLGFPSDALKWLNDAYLLPKARAFSKQYRFACCRLVLRANPDMLRSLTTYIAMDAIDSE